MKINYHFLVFDKHNDCIANLSFGEDKEGAVKHCYSTKHKGYKTQVVKVTIQEQIIHEHSQIEKSDNIKIKTCDGIGSIVG